MKIYTKTGDEGNTSLIGGTRVSKAHLRLQAYGTVDELNAYLGLLRDQEVNRARAGLLKQIQDNLFVMGSILATDPENNTFKLPILQPEEVTTLENAIDEMNTQLEPLRNFILPGGSLPISFGHIARTVCRRAERHIIALDHQEPVEDLLKIYINRLSDYLFVLCRMMHHELEIPETIWKPRT